MKFKKSEILTFVTLAVTGAGMLLSNALDEASREELKEELKNELLEELGN